VTPASRRTLACKVTLPTLADEAGVVEAGADGQTPSYERARDELAEVVRRLEAGGTTLEESLVLWERGEELARICQSWLDGARARLAEVAPEVAVRPEA
jgi:exodeoxyribonuclease VII small subunit